MTAALPPVLIDPDELLRMPNEKDFELIDGVPEERTMGTKSELIAFDLGTVLSTFVKQHDLGCVCGSNFGYVCFPGRPRHLRKPDLSFIAKSRLPTDWPPEGYIPIAPDLVLEAISPNDLAEELEVKLAEYRGAGVRLVWVVSPTARTVQVRRLDGSAQILQESDTLSGEAVVPGFEVPVASLFV